MTNRIAALLAVSFSALVTGGPALAQAPDFGSDTSVWANDGECDDPRFAGEGMTGTRLLEEDSGHDASDCRAAVEAGKLHLK